MSENVVGSRVEKLEEQVQNLSQKVGGLLEENMVLIKKSNKSDWWVRMLSEGYWKLYQRVEALETRCATLELGADPKLLQPSSLGTTMREEKSLNSDQYFAGIVHSQLPHTYPGSANGGCTAAMEFDPRIPDPDWIAQLDPHMPYLDGNSQFDPHIPYLDGKAREITPEVGLPTPPYEGHASQPYGYHASSEGGPSTGAGAWGSPITTTPTTRKRKAREMSEGSLNTTLSSSNSNGVRLTFLNTFSESSEWSPASSQTRTVKKPKARAQPRTPPEEPKNKQQACGEHLVLQVHEECPMPQVHEERPMSQAHDESPIPEEQGTQDMEMQMSSADMLFLSDPFDLDCPLLESNDWVV